jgi:hypothetical protein
MTLVVIDWLLFSLLLLQKHPEVHIQHKSEALRKRRAIVDVPCRAAEDKAPIYRQTREEIGAGKDTLSTKKKF